MNQTIRREHQELLESLAAGKLPAEVIGASAKRTKGASTKRVRNEQWERRIEEDWQRHLESLRQCICELLSGNQPPRREWMEADKPGQE